MNIGISTKYVHVTSRIYPNLVAVLRLKRSRRWAWWGGALVIAPPVSLCSESWVMDCSPGAQWVVPASGPHFEPPITRQLTSTLALCFCSLASPPPLLPPPAGNMAPTGDDHYHPKDTVHSSVYQGAMFGGIGLLFAAARNSLAKTNVGPWTTFTRHGGLVATFGTCLHP